MSRAAARVRRAFAAAGVRGWLHACDVDDPSRALDVDGSLRVPLASTFKLHVAVALARAIDAGEIDPRETIRVGARRTSGPTGLAAMRDPVRMSVRDLAYLMLAVSDNAACDALYDRLGPEAIDCTLSDLGLRNTTLRGCCRDLTRSMAADVGVSDPADVPGRLQDPGVLERLAVLDPGRTSCSTPREMTRLLGALWRDRAASPEACAEVRPDLHTAEPAHRGRHDRARKRAPLRRRGLHAQPRADVQPAPGRRRDRRDRADGGRGAAVAASRNAASTGVSWRRRSSPRSASPMWRTRPRRLALLAGGPSRLHALGQALGAGVRARGSK